MLHADLKLELNVFAFSPLSVCLHYFFTEQKAEIDQLAAEYVANVKKLASEERVQHLQKIENAYTKCKEYSDDKVQLAMQIYEMVSAYSQTA